MKNIVLLGSTGSIGTSTIKVAEDLPDHIRLIGLAAGKNVDDLSAQAHTLKPQLISISDDSLRASLADKAPEDVRVTSGTKGLIELATLPDADIVLIAIVGIAGLEPALATIRAGKDIAVASKEILVMAGEIVMREAKEHGVRVLAVDSEHSAILQCLDTKPETSVRSLWLTASGGPFRQRPKEEFADIQLSQALKHPSWDMGQKITIDSATLFNKGLEMIEARWLFDIEIPRVKVIVHPQSVIHSMVEFIDGSIIAQLSTPDMCLPIQYALTYPKRVGSNRVLTDLARIASLTFEEPDTEKFPSLNLAREAGLTGGTLPAVLNAANEVAVDAFCRGAISFPRIAETVAQTMAAHQTKTSPSLQDILEADRWTRSAAAEIVAN
ncbi:MAG: 1-deoxy-D-xylulose 5-phosphate reductoisomerase [Verrucomicrobia subdivision 3 bacterium]|nr:1-deoxy-D-xylulose 5-phosphate reductoisomerase [Limisphaerales bacterium]MCS1415690.1 1-deoxy-D-xylulose 5-phosphate reductoisomerase [Limisphaerales bacterium]